MFVRRICSVVFGFGLLLGSAAAQPSAEPAPQVHNIALEFARFWDADQGKPTAQQVADFKKSVAARFPEFYGIERYQGGVTQAGQDERIANAIASFGPIRQAYIRKAKDFDAQLPRYVEALKHWFPDYRPTAEVYVLHSLGEMDAGPRTLNGRDYLIFGVDMMVKYHGANDESAFFEHELFHKYHDAVMSSCPAGRVWSTLWKEGLATWVSKTMNPGASEQELLLEFPASMPSATRAVLGESLAQLERVLDSDDRAIWQGLFQMRGDDGTGLPQRRGYYLGYLVAQEAGKSRDLRELARLDCEQARQLVSSTVSTLRAKQK
jgi:hypothetical protein